jgi:hypothetical protein
MGMRSNTNQVGQGMGQTLTEEEKKNQQDQQQAQQPQLPQTRAASMQSSAQQAPAVKALPKQQQAGTGTFANLKSYLQAAQGGGQQKIAQAATQKIQNVAGGAQSGIQQAQRTFGRQVGAGTIANLDTAVKEAEGFVNTARGVTYQGTPATQPVAAPTQATNAPAGATPTTTTEVPATAPAEPVQQQYFTPEEIKRFGEIVNAQYLGPESLQQAGLYNDIAQRARTAQQAINRTASAAGREELLRDIFSQGRDYSRGQSKLDALLLNTSQQGISELQRQAQQAGNVQQQAEKAQTESANLAAERLAQTSAAQQQARKAFLTGRTEEEALTETRMDKLIKEPVLDTSGKPIPKLDMEGKPIVDSAGQPVYQTKWDQLPEYFRDAIRNKETTNKAIQAEQLANLESSTGLNEQGYKAAQKKVAIQAEQLKKAQAGLIQGLFGQNISKEDAALVQERVSMAQANLEASKKELAGYSDFMSQLKDIKNMSMDQLRLSPEEAAILGISSGEGLYNTEASLIKDVVAERERLITKDELARQQALAKLAETDISRALQKDLKYSDMEKAGSQTLSSSLDTKAIRDTLNEAQKIFKESAEAETLTGRGKKKVSRGNWSGKRTKTYYAKQAGNVADMLRQAGYDVSGESPEAARSLLSDKEALANYLKATSGSRSDSGSMYAEGAAKTAAGAATGASIGAALPPTAPITATAGAIIGGTLGSVIGDNSTLSNIVGDLGGGRMSSSEMKRVGEGTAKELAIKDLERQYKAYLEGQGFANRANIVDSGATSARTAALRDLLLRKE